MEKSARYGAFAAAFARDLIGIAGLGLIVAGVSVWSEAAAMIVGGSLCTGFAVLWARRGG